MSFKEPVKEFYRKIPKVELHVHFDGSTRVSTLMEVARQQGLDFPQDKEEFLNTVSVDGPQDSLLAYLRPLPNLGEILSSSLETIERCAYEFCEDSAAQGVVYTEPRTCLHLLTTKKKFTPEEALQAMLRGLKRGQQDFGIKTRVLLCILKMFPLEWAHEVVELAKKYRNDGVVGIDIAGGEHVPYKDYYPCSEEAKRSNIYVTAHAGESGPAKNVQEAIEALGATRIGHGYHLVEDPEVVKLVKEKGIHLEACPISSIYTNSGGFELKSLKKYAEYGLSFSLNSDDPGVMRTELSRDYQAVVEMYKLDKSILRKAVFNAAEATFLPKEEKAQLLDELNIKFKEFEKQFGSL
jgi:adenosine deaminase